MAVLMKTRQQVALLRDAGRIVAETYEALKPHVVPGVTSVDLDHIAEELCAEERRAADVQGLRRDARPPGRLVRRRSPRRSAWRSTT